MLRPRFFQSGAEFREWLEGNHAKSAALLLGFHKTSSGKGGITYQQALDHALCYGWIDGVRTNFDTTSYTIRFSPRKAKSHWSLVNMKRVPELKAQGLMTPAGLDAYERRDEGRTINYSYELKAADLGPAFEKQFRANKKAWAYFELQAPSYRRLATFWVTSAKKEETRGKRLAILIADSAAGRRLAAATPGKK